MPASGYVDKRCLSQLGMALATKSTYIKSLSIEVPENDGRSRAL